MNLGTFKSLTDNFVYNAEFWLHWVTKVTCKLRNSYMLFKDNLTFCGQPEILTWLDSLIMNPYF